MANIMVVCFTPKLLFGGNGTLPFWTSIPTFNSFLLEQLITPKWQNILTNIFTDFPEFDGKALVFDSMTVFWRESTRTICTFLQNPRWKSNKSQLMTVPVFIVPQERALKINQGQLLWQARWGGKRKEEAKQETMAHKLSLESYESLLEEWEQAGPDTWMEGDIEIVDRKKLPNTVKWPTEFTVKNAEAANPHRIKMERDGKTDLGHLEWSWTTPTIRFLSQSLPK